MKTGPALGFFVALFLLPKLLLVAQISQQASHAPDGGTRITIISIAIPPIPNAPFTAMVRTEVIRHLENGSTSTVKNHRSVARDSSGRIFQERRLLTQDGDTHETAITQLEFSDPTTHHMYICDRDGHACTLRPYFAPTSMSPALLQGSDEGGPQSLNLGSAIVEGVDTIGTRETEIVNPTGTGNSQAILVNKEFWYSPQLGINMITKRFDPRFGTQTFLVTDVILGEPDPKLLELPAGATILRLTPQSQSGQDAPPY